MALGRKFKEPSLHPDDLEHAYDISGLKKGDLVVLQDYCYSDEPVKNWEVMQDGKDRRTVPIQIVTIHEGGTVVEAATLRTGDAWRKVGRIDEPDIATRSGAADTGETRKPDDRRDDIFRKIFN